MNELSLMVQFYHDRYGAYPPNLSDRDAVGRHVEQRFPENKDPLPLEGDAAESLFFWLSLNPSDRQRPFTSPPRQPALHHPWQYTAFPHNGRLFRTPDFEAPIVYFCSESYSTQSYGSLRPYHDTTVETATGETIWCNPDSFQLISAGHDGQFGTGGGFPSGEGLSDLDHDNLANFGSDGRTLVLADLTLDRQAWRDRLGWINLVLVVVLVFSTPVMLMRALAAVTGLTQGQRMAITVVLVAIILLWLFWQAIARVRYCSCRHGAPHGTTSPAATG